MRWRRSLHPRAIFYAVVALAACAPIWLVRYPPISDWPFHLSTIRVLHDLHDPAFAFDRDFVLSLGRTQYLAYYVAGSALASVFGVVGANLVLVSGYLGGTVLAMRALLLGLGKDERLCLLVVPLLYNVLFAYGLVPFLLGIPLLLWGLAVALRYFARPSAPRGVLLAVILLVLFYSHVFPFLLLAIGMLAMFPWREPLRWLRAALPAVPAAASFLVWTFATEAGRLARGALGDVEHDPHKRVDGALARAHAWLTDIFQDPSDDVLFVAAALVALAAIALAQGERDRSRRVSRAYALLPAACALLYFATPDSHDYIAIIAQRFPIMFAITAVPLLRMPRGVRGHVVSLAALVVAAASVVNTAAHFREFQGEVGNFDGALAAIPRGQRVCALMFDPRSRIMKYGDEVKLAPFMHFGSYYQLEKGGVVEFTFAGYPHWPVDFAPGRAPTTEGRAWLYWEWFPGRVGIGEIFPYFDYVLTRGEGFAPPPGTYRVKWSDGPWTVWEKA